MAPQMYIFNNKVLKLHVFEVVSKFVDDNFKKNVSAKWVLCPKENRTFKGHLLYAKLVSILKT